MMENRGRQTIESRRNGTEVSVEEGVEYLILNLPDGTTLDISIDPYNGNNHIKMYDDNGYAVIPMDSSSKVRGLEVWNGPVNRSTRKGTVPGPVETVEPHEEAWSEDDLINRCVVCGEDMEPVHPNDPPTCGQDCWEELKKMSEKCFEQRRE
jgi:hypothetical protein